MSRRSDGWESTGFGVGARPIFLAHYAGRPTGAKLSMLAEKLISQAEGAKISDAERLAGD